MKRTVAILAALAFAVTIAWVADVNDLQKNTDVPTTTSTPVRFVEVINFPDPQNVAGTVAVSNLPAAQTVSVTVPGTSDPWLAGMPAGSTASSGDIAPAESPVEVLGLTLAPGGLFKISAAGGVANDPRFRPSGQTALCLRYIAMVPRMGFRML